MSRATTERVASKKRRGAGNTPASLGRASSRHDPADSGVRLGCIVSTLNQALTTLLTTYFLGNRKAQRSRTDRHFQADGLATFQGQEPHVQFQAVKGIGLVRAAHHACPVATSALAMHTRPASTRRRRRSMRSTAAWCSAGVMGECINVHQVEAASAGTPGSHTSRSRPVGRCNPTSARSRAGPAPGA